MAIDPKLGGKCWSCKYCEDIGTHDDNPSATYMRKCNHGAYDYVDKCSFYCSSYVWDGVDEAFRPSSSSSGGSNNSYTSSSTSSNSSSNSSGCGKFFIIAAIIIAIIAGITFIPGLFSGEKKSEDKPAAVSSEQKTAVIYNVNNSLRMRQSADSSSAVITTIPKGETVTIIEEGAEWCRVKYGEHEGYCATECLDIQ